MSGYPFMVMNCPHCHTQRVSCEVNAFKGEANHTYGIDGYLTANCAVCSHPISVSFHCNEGNGIKILDDFSEMIRFSKSKMNLDKYNLRQFIKIIKIWPEAPKPKAFQFLPPQVNAAMNDAEKARSVGTPNRMVRGAYRTVIDVATQHVFEENLPSFEKGTNSKQNLNNRINMLASAHFLTPSIKDWAHGIRHITNEDVHTSNAVSEEEVAEIAEFTDMLLQYLFELPGRVERAKTDAEQKRATT
ncbi:DUF4145 domain-containing protein [Acetobacter orientalis]|uniref:DUF4145 domain-containing protein n=1 Tax=Acetobacter orientalis TaxID=146474 RepID=UPI0039EC5DC5